MMIRLKHCFWTFISFCLIAFIILGSFLVVKQPKSPSEIIKENEIIKESTISQHSPLQILQELNKWDSFFSLHKLNVLLDSDQITTKKRIEKKTVALPKVNDAFQKLSNKNYYFSDYYQNDKWRKTVDSLISWETRDVVFVTINANIWSSNIQYFLNLLNNNKNYLDFFKQQKLNNFLEDNIYLSSNRNDFDFFINSVVKGVVNKEIELVDDSFYTKEQNYETKWIEQHYTTHQQSPSPKIDLIIEKDKIKIQINQIWGNGYLYKVKNENIYYPIIVYLDLTFKK